MEKNQFLTNFCVIDVSFLWFKMGSLDLNTGVQILAAFLCMNCTVSRRMRHAVRCVDWTKGDDLIGKRF